MGPMFDDSAPLATMTDNGGGLKLVMAVFAAYGNRLEPCVRLIRHQPNGFHSKISFGSTVSAAKRAMNIADAINTPK